MRLRALIVGLAVLPELFSPPLGHAVTVEGRFRTDARAAFETLGLTPSDIVSVERQPLGQARSSSFFCLISRGAGSETLRFTSRDLPPLLVSALESRGRLSGESISAGDLALALGDTRFVSTIQTQLDGIGPPGSAGRAGFWRSVDEAVERKALQVAGTAPGGELVATSGGVPVTAHGGTGLGTLSPSGRPLATGFPVGTSTLGAGLSTGLPLGSGYTPGLALPSYASFPASGYGGFGYGGYGHGGYLNVFNPFFLASLPFLQRFNDLKQRAEFFLASAKALRLSSGFGFARFGRGSRGVRLGGRAKVNAKAAPAAP